jgi:hypothetical protein
MKNRMMMLFAFLAAFVLSAPVLAAPPEGDAPAAVEAAGETGDTKAEAPAEKADEKAAHEAKADGTDDAKEPKVVETDEEAIEAAEGLYSALVDRNWALAIAFGLTLLVFGLRKLKILDKVPAKTIPIVTAVLAMVGYVAAALMTPGVAIGPAVMEGFAAGAAAVGLWEMLFKHFLAGKKAEPEEEVAESVAGDGND